MIAIAEFFPRKKRVIKRREGMRGDWIYYADGSGIYIEHNYGNVSHFDHNMTDPYTLTEVEDD